MGAQRTRLIWALAVVGVAAVVAGPLAVGHGRAEAVQRWGVQQCRQALATPGRSDEIELPLAYRGTPTSCALRRTEGHLFGRFTGTGYYVVRTDRGLFVSRLDYTTPGLRFAPGRTTELRPDEVPDGVLSAAEARAYATGVAARGGVTDHPWSWGQLDG